MQRVLMLFLVLLTGLAAALFLYKAQVAGRSLGPIDLLKSLLAAALLLLPVVLATLVIWMRRRVLESTARTEDALLHSILPELVVTMDSAKSVVIPYQPSRIFLVFSVGLCLLVVVTALIGMATQGPAITLLHGSGVAAYWRAFIGIVTVILFGYIGTVSLLALVRSFGPARSIVIAPDFIRAPARMHMTSNETIRFQDMQYCRLSGTRRKRRLEVGHSGKSMLISRMAISNEADFEKLAHLVTLRFVQHRGR
ncbi:MAG: hypothetical protein AB7V26_02945 [Lysobacterales bacterium]